MTTNEGTNSTKYKKKSKSLKTWGEFGFLVGQGGVKIELSVKV